jgi:hypothetical protein
MPAKKRTNVPDAKDDIVKQVTVCNLCMISYTPLEEIGKEIKAS